MRRYYADYAQLAEAAHAAPELLDLALRPAGPRLQTDHNPMTFTIRTLDELAGYFAAKAREMNEISAKRTGLIKHNYAGQAHAYQDAAITIRMCKIEVKSRSKKQPAPLAAIKGLNEEIEK
jgi:hypothetical protein